MEEVEETNKAAIEICHRLLNLLQLPKDQTQYKYNNIFVETEEAVCKFKKVASLLGSTLGHARFRKNKKIKTPFPQNIFLESPMCRIEENQPKRHKLLEFISLEKPVQDLGSKSNPLSVLPLGNLSLGLSSSSSHGDLSNLQLSQQIPPSSYNFLNQHQLYQLQQHQVKQAEMLYNRSNSGISLNFESSTCTPSMSSSRSFISSLSIDGSVANMNGNGFQSIGPLRSAEQSSFQHKRKCSGRGEDCRSGDRCHCSKKRKHRVKRSIRVPAISNKLADIPLMNSRGENMDRSRSKARLILGVTISAVALEAAQQENMWKDVWMILQCSLLHMKENIIILECRLHSL